jgi:hypothetical protein
MAKVGSLSLTSLTVKNWEFYRSTAASANVIPSPATEPSR